ncbi:MAG: hypothetical protein WC975_13905 [Phycisphaerae bacterium]
MMFHKWMFGPVILLIGSGMLNASRATNPNTDAEVKIGPRVIKKDLNPYNFCCINWEANFDQHTLRKIFSKPDHYKEFIRFCREDVSMRTFRYPGGSFVSRFFPGVPSRRWFADFLASSPGTRNARPDDWIEVDEFFKFLKDGQFKTFLQVNTLSWFDEKTGKIKPMAIKVRESDKLPSRLDPAGLTWAADSVERLAQWVKKNNYQSLVSVWEIGNEEYAFYTYDVYVAVAAEFIQRIKKILPDARIIITGQMGVNGDAWSNNWSQGVLKDLKTRQLGSSIDGVTTHIYPFSAGVPKKKPQVLHPSTAYQEYAANVSFLPDDPVYHPWFPQKNHRGQTVSVMGQIRDQLDQLGYSQTTIWLTEYRLGGIYEPYNKAMANAIGTLRVLAGFVGAPRVDGACIHSLLHGSHVTRKDQSLGKIPFQAAGYNVIYYLADDDLAPRFVGSPVAEGFNLIWKLAQGNVLESKSSNRMLFSVATRQGSTLRLLVINKAAKPEKASDVLPNTWGWETSAKALAAASQSGDQIHTVISLPAGFPPQSTVKIYMLGETERLADFSVENGTFDRVHEIKVKSKIHPVQGNKVHYTFAPHSAVLFEFVLKKDTP